METLITIEDLAKVFRSQIGEAEVKPDKLKYVMYLRKSTEEKGKQIRSIPDQKKECLEYAKREGISISEKDIVIETRSAKESGTRPYFKKMIEDLVSGKYNAILAWHPDRLARNMKDAGEIIDLLDKGSIVDMKFVSFTFSNDTSGKLLLGITFAMSKEYSDKLSDNVMRGNTRKMEEGKIVSFIPKGYYKDKNDIPRADTVALEVIKEAFKLRLQGETLETIASYINNQTARVNTTAENKLGIYRKQQVMRMLENPFYAGIYLHGNKIEILGSNYEFTPVITPEEYLLINKKVSEKSTKLKRVLKFFKKEGVKADFLRQCILCSECGHTMSAGIMTKKTSKGEENRFHYRCDQTGCKAKNKSVRPSIVINYVSDYLEKNFTPTKENWEHYKVEAKKDFALLKSRITGELVSLTSRQTSIINAMTDTRSELRRLGENFNLKLQKDYEADYAKMSDELKEVENIIEEYKAKSKETLKLLDQGEFLELMKNMPSFIRDCNNMKVLDETLRKVFLNFTILNKKVIKSTLNSPFDILFDTKVSLGAQERT